MPVSMKSFTSGLIDAGAKALTGGLASGVGSLVSGLFGGNDEKKKMQQQFANEKELMGLQATYNEKSFSFLVFSSIKICEELSAK